MAAPGHKRSSRVAERVRSELTDMFIRGQVRDPRVANIVVSAVRVSDDLGTARIYVRTLQEVDADAADGVVEALQGATGFIRRELGQRLGLRYVPALKFFWDDVVDAGQRIESLLQEIGDPEAAP